MKYLFLCLLLNWPCLTYALNWEVRKTDGTFYTCSSPMFDTIGGSLKYKKDGKNAQSKVSEIDEILIKKCKKKSCYGEIILRNGNKSRFKIKRDCTFKCADKDGHQVAFVLDAK